MASNRAFISFVLYFIISLAAMAQDKDIFYYNFETKTTSQKEFAIS